jgi:hypothetical protein
MADSNDNSSYTRGPLAAALIAVFAVIIIFVAMFLFNPRKTAVLSVTKVDLFAPHTEFKDLQGAIHVLGEAAASEDDLYVVAHVKLTDKLRLPIFLSDWTATVTLADGRTLDATTVPATQLPRLEETFPALTPLVSQPLHYGDEVAPGATTEGSVVLLFPNTTQAAWQSKHSAVLTIELRDQNPQTAPLP